MFDLFTVALKIKHLETVFAFPNRNKIRFHLNKTIGG